MSATRLDEESGIAVHEVVHTVIETARFLASAEQEGLTEDERVSIVAFVAKRPTAGVIIPNTVGLERFDLAAAAKGRAADIGL